MKAHVVEAVLTVSTIGCIFTHILSPPFSHDDTVSDMDKSRNVSVKRRWWSDLEERRLRAWKRENKSESWIASKLDRTVSAVRQQWRKMSEEKS